MAEKKKTQKSKKSTEEKEEKKDTKTKSTKAKTKSKSTKVKLTFHPVAAGAKEMNVVLRTKKNEERNGRNVIVNAPLIDGLPEVLKVQRDEVIEVTQAQCDELEKLGLVESEAEYKERKAFVENLKTQHPDKLSYAQMDGATGDFLTLRDSQHKVYMDKLIRI